MIYVLDELTVKPGRLADVETLLCDRYAPMVAPFAMTLVHRWIDPAVELLDDPTTLLVMWELPDRQHFWSATLSTRRDPEVTRVWNDVAHLVVERRRRIMAERPHEAPT